MTTPADRVNDALENLDDKEFRKFHFQLQQAPNLEGHQPIKRANLQNKDTMDTALLIVQHYPKHVNQIMVNVLTKIARIDLTEMFEEEVVPKTSGNSEASSPEPNMAMEVVPKTSSPGPNMAMAQAASPTSCPEVDFVNKHRRALIGRVTSLAPILDLLAEEGVMRSEDYCNVRAEKITQEKMRELFVLLDNRGARAKRVFYKGLEENEAYLVHDLKNPE